MKTVKFLFIKYSEYLNFKFVLNNFTYMSNVTVNISFNFLCWFSSKQFNLDFNYFFVRLLMHIPNSLWYSPNNNYSEVWISFDSKLISFHLPNEIWKGDGWRLDTQEHFMQTQWKEIIKYTNHTEFCMCSLVFLFFLF